MLKKLSILLSPFNHQLHARQSFLIFQSSLAALTILPFGIWRFIIGDITQGIADLILVLLLISMNLLAMRNRLIAVTTWTFAIVYTLGTWYAVYSFGAETIFWAYVAGIAIHFILRTQEALLINFVLLAGSLFLAQSLPTLTLATFSVTYLLVIVFTLQFTSRMRYDNQTLMDIATKDPLTLAGNRRALDDLIIQIIEQRHESSHPASMLILDIDFFKQVNDQYGHLVGDVVLKRLTKILRQQVDKDSQIFRYGGEEFCIITPKPLKQAAAMAEQLKESIAQTNLIREQVITVSIGVAELGSLENARDWFRKADNALYQAKRLGRNQVQS